VEGVHIKPLLEVQVQRGKAIMVELHRVMSLHIGVRVVAVLRKQVLVALQVLVLVVMVLQAQYQEHLLRTQVVVEVRKESQDQLVLVVQVAVAHQEYQEQLIEVAAAVVILPLEMVVQVL
jgi:hypothetical protein